MLESMPINVVGDVVQLPSLLGPINRGSLLIWIPPSVLNTLRNLMESLLVC